MKKNINSKNVSLSILSLLFCSNVLFCQEYPNPVGFVNDFANVISQEYRDKITGLCTEIEQKTGVELVIATVKTALPQTIDMYAVELFSRWGIGKKGKDNGILIVAALGDHKVFIKPGYGAEGFLTDGICGEISRQIIAPEFKKGEFGKGLFLASNEIANRVEKEYNVKLEGVTNTKVSENLPLGTVIFLIIVFIVIFSKLGVWGLIFLPGGRGQNGRHNGYWTGGNFGGGGFGGGFGGFGGGSCGGGGGGSGW
ncbi:MAG: TPM domain-containing protein [bacterium]|nr:TPM domain-containing protein [bacterium]